MSCLPERLAHLEATISCETSSSAPLVHRLQRLEEHCLGGPGVGGQVFPRLCRVEEVLFGNSSSSAGGLPREMEIPSGSMVCIPDRLGNLEAAVFADNAPSAGPILSRLQQLEEQVLGMKCCGGGRTISRICRLEESIFGSQSCGANGLPREREGQFDGVVGMPERIEHLEAAFFSDPPPTAAPLMDRLQSLEAQCLGAQGIGGRFLARVAFLEESAFGVQSRDANGLPRELEINYQPGSYAQGKQPYGGPGDRPTGGSVQGSRRPYDDLPESELRGLSHYALRDHADHMLRVLGNMAGLPPDDYDGLISWIVASQRSARRSDSNGRGGLFGEGMLLAEAHSAETQDLIREFPGLANAVVKDIRQGIRKFHDGFYGADFGTSQQKLAEDIYGQYCLDRPDSFWGYMDKFHKFTVVVGPMAFAGNMPYFSYKVAYPQQWSYKDQVAWITVFFTLKDLEITKANVALEPRAFDERRLPIASERELRSFDHMSLCDRADLLYRTLGPDRIAIRPPDTYEDLVSWILRVQRLHLEEPGSRVQEADTRVPVLSEFEIRAMDRTALRQHARLLSSRLGSDRAGFAIPILDSDLPEWIQRVQRSQVPFARDSSPRISVSPSLQAKSPIRSSSVRGGEDSFGQRSYQERLDDLGKSPTYRDNPAYGRAEEPYRRSVSPRRDEPVYRSSISPSQRWR